MLKDLSFLWTTELMFSFWELLHICVAWSRSTSGTCEQVFQSRTTGGQSKVLHFLILPQKHAFLMSPLKFSVELKSRDWAGHSIMLILLVWNHNAAAYWCVWGCCPMEMPISKVFPLWHKATWLLQVFWCIQTDPWSLVCDK